MALTRSCGSRRPYNKKQWHRAPMGVAAVLKVRPSPTPRRCNWRALDRHSRLRRALGAPVGKNKVSLQWRLSWGAMTCVVFWWFVSISSPFRLFSWFFIFYFLPSSDHFLQILFLFTCLLHFLLFLLLQHKPTAHFSPIAARPSLANRNASSHCPAYLVAQVGFLQPGVQHRRC